MVKTPNKINCIISDITSILNFCKTVFKDFYHRSNHFNNLKTKKN